VAAILGGIAQDRILAGDVAGKPRKLATLANFVPQVAMRLSHPARTVKVSVPAMARTGASSRVRMATPSTRSCDSTSARRPALAPLVQSTVPKVNQPEVKPPSPEAVKARSRSRSMIAPVPLKAGASRLTPQRASPRAASQLA
jgi:hypothetical protein